MHFKDALALSIYGMTATEAHHKGICISCRQVPQHQSTIDVKEYRISGLCGDCFDEITREGEIEDPLTDEDITF